MSSFTHRDRRLVATDAAMAALEPRMNELKTLLGDKLDAQEGMEAEAKLRALHEIEAQISKERIALAVDGFETGDAFAERLARSRRSLDGSAVVGLMDRDPLYISGQRSWTLNDALSREGGEPRAGLLPEAAEGVGEPGAEEENFGAALADWHRSDPATRRAPFKDIGVLLPLRLETIFDDRGGFWEMSLRIVPDEISIRRDQPRVTTQEKEFLDAFWARSSAMEPVEGTHCSAWLDHPEGAAAWEELAARVTPSRAAWLVSNFLANIKDGAFAAAIPAERLGDNRNEQIAGLPSELKVVVVDMANKSTEIGSLFPDLSGEDFDLPKGAGDQAFTNWLLSWDKAQTVGMGGVFELPDGIGPDGISALYVFGIGDENASELFRAHADAGTLALMRLGAPTNTVHGMPASDLATDAPSWLAIARQRLTSNIGPGIGAVAAALCGDRTALPALPGASGDMEDGRLLVRALWPALWGHYFRDLLEGGESAMQLWQWCLEALYPEGLLPPVRVGAQPYGILPVTPLKRWQPLDGDQLASVEEKIVRALELLVPQWKAAAERRGTVVGSDTHGLLNLLARPGVSSRYSYRTYTPAAIQHAAYPGVDQDDFMKMAEQLWSPAFEASGHQMVRTYLAQGGARRLRLPLIGSDRLLPPDIGITDMLVAVYDTVHDLFGMGFFEEYLKGLLPKSLLVRLMIHSVLLAKAWAVQVAPTVATPLVNPEHWTDPETLTDLERLQMDFPGHPGSGEMIDKLMHDHRDAIFTLGQMLDEGIAKGDDPLFPGKDVQVLQLPPERHWQLERALRAILDTAGHRIDPFATGVAIRRLEAATGSGASFHRLGAYGWLDGPFIGKPGPTKAGRLHAPSHAQAITSIVLRDKQLSSQDETAGNGVWDMKLSSPGVRLALEIAEEIRLGFHVYEVVGRRVESIIGNRDKVRELRRRKPLRPHAPDERDICHGTDALAGLLSDEGIPGILDEDPDKQQKQMAGFAALRTALEDFSDLLTAQGVHQVVSGRPDRAADAMDASSGFATMPDLDVVRTPPSGYRLGTSVIGLFAHRTVGPGAAPLELADASVAGFVSDRFPAADWTWTVTKGDETSVVSLTDLGIAPVEAVLMSEDFLTQAVCSSAGLPDAQVETPHAHRLSRLLTTGLGGGPAVLSDVTKDPDVSDEEALRHEELVRNELIARYKHTRDELSALVKRLRFGAPANATRIALLREAVAWGFVGPADSAPPTLLADILFGQRQPDDGELTDLLLSAEQVLAARIPDDADPPEKLPLGLLVQALGDFVAPGSRLTVTARWDRANLVANAALSGAAEAALEEDWLAVVAAVRPPLARLEALQIEARHLGRGVPLAAWSNVPGDPWRTALAKANAEERENGNVTAIRLDRLVAGFGAPDALEGSAVAVALIDQFSEAIPMSQRSTYAAFGFNSPAARPPQAILLAVPAHPDKLLDGDELLQILNETRDLLRVRAAQPGDAIHPLMPTAWLDASGPLRLRLDNGSQYRR